MVRASPAITVAPFARRGRARRRELDARDLGAGPREHDAGATAPAADIEDHVGGPECGRDGEQHTVARGLTRPCAAVNGVAGAHRANGQAPVPQLIVDHLNCAGCDRSKPSRSSVGANWLGDLDSNQDCSVQSREFYR